MAVPDYQSLTLPLLKFADEQKAEVSTGDAVGALAKQLGLTDADLKELLPSDVQPTFVNRVAWASTYMKKAGLLESTRWGHYRITPRGKELLAKKPKVINKKLLKQYPEFLAFRQPKGTRTDREKDTKIAAETVTATPSEALENAYENLRDELGDELLSRVKKSTPAFFERILVELLVKMGYGGSRDVAAEPAARTADLARVFSVTVG